MAAATLLSVLVTVLSYSPGIAVAYLWMVLGVGPRLMSNREPLVLKPLVALYNLTQVLCNASLLWRSVVMFLDRRYNVTCPGAVPRLDVFSVREEDAFDLEVTRIAHYQASLRLLDLTDTLFMVLGKKNDKMSFLHLYHHSSVVVYSWLILQMDPGAGVTLLPASINNFVHAIMYSYYLLALFGCNLARRFKRYITQLQILQFVLVELYLLHALLRKDCNTSVPIILLSAAQGFIFLVLFSNFYRKSYQTKRVV